MRTERNENGLRDDVLLKDTIICKLLTQHQYFLSLISQLSSIAVLMALVCYCFKLCCNCQEGEEEKGNSWWNLVCFSVILQSGASGPSLLEDQDKGSDARNY